MYKDTYYLDLQGGKLSKYERNWARFEIRTRFSRTELLALREFYAGVPARLIRQKYCDPWYVLARHRALSEELYEALKWELIQLPARQQEKPQPRRLPRPVPRWRKCPYCEQWIDSGDWRSRRHADHMIGFRYSGCQNCFEEKWTAYKRWKEREGSLTGIVNDKGGVDE